MSTTNNPTADADAQNASAALAGAVQQSENASNVTDSIHAHGHEHHWLQKLVPGIEKIVVKTHTGNFIAVRDKSKPPGSEKIFESMPIYARLGMHLLFYGKGEVRLLESSHKVENLLKEQSVKQGAIYDSPSSAKSIPSFVETYKLDLSELLEPDPSKYATFNEFFYRKLKDGARPVENNSPEAFCSAADCRLTVFESVSDAQKFWIKGDEFTLKNLLYGKTAAAPEVSFPLDEAELAIFRLAPADYHRFHSPIDGTIVGEPTNIDGTYYTVNPQAVNEANFDVFTANKRSVIYIKHDLTGQIVAFVAIGALLVGAIGWTAKPGTQVKKGEELGYFAYGGSTVITVFPKNFIKFDEDLVVNSKNTLETLVKVGWSLGTKV
ncbi:hypothetical protein BD410DRAFT_789065 [Rickenella mellea]|uniref:phosphatidylserine decarboxylase n=1 Tax=Rickenella mellea TaxID=50990 RepID=A0A4Y7Q2V9_9AGAM|nr:hypothetical protein BD410DRAFT_789065 [Rickenella mellea]